LSDSEHLQKRSIDNSRLDANAAGSSFSDNNTSNTTSIPPVNVSYTTRTLKKGELSGKSLKTGDLEPILKGLYKLREHSYKASKGAKERLEIATQSLLERKD